MTILENNRNIYMDAVKAFAIFLVVMGHAVQYISGTDFWNNPIYQIIYSVHMPLFFVISGFFFVGQQNKSFKEFLSRKVMTLLLPCVVWASLSGLLTLIHNGGIFAFINKILSPLNWPFWFLKGLFSVQLIAWISLVIARKIAPKHYVWVAALLSLCVFFIPYTEVARVMLPIFWAGWFLRMHYEWILDHKGIISIVASIIFIVLLFFWGNEGMRFYSATPLNLYGYLLGTPYPWEDWLWLIYRVLIGCTGSLAIIALFHLPQYIPSWIQQVGTSTQAIYILQACLLEHFIGGFIAQKTAWLVPIQQLPPLCLFCVALPMIAISLVGLCVLLYRPIRRVPILSSLLFGTAPSCRK